MFSVEILSRQESELLRLRSMTLGKRDMSVQRSIGFDLMRIRKERKKAEMREKLAKAVIAGHKCVKCNAPVPGSSQSSDESTIPTQ